MTTKEYMVKREQLVSAIRKIGMDLAELSDMEFNLGLESRSQHTAEFASTVLHSEIANQITKMDRQLLFPALNGTV